MKASWLIGELQDCIKNHGDVEVQIMTDRKYYETDSVETVYYSKEDNSIILDGEINYEDL